VVKLDKIYTRGGDKGYTSLGDGVRVSKHHLRIEAIGTVDEVNASIGLVRYYSDESVKRILLDIQHDLFDVGADLCTPAKENPKREALRVQQSQIDRLEAIIDELNLKLEPLTSFILPGGSQVSSYLHLSRAIVRRGERVLAKLMDEEDINPLCFHYLNRLSDLLFVLCRHCNDGGKKDILWKPGKNL